MKHTLTQIVKGTTARLSYMCEGKCYYIINVPNESQDPNIELKDSIYQLELDSMTDEWKTTYLYPEFKAIALMRWIRKSMDKDDEKFIQLS